MHSRTRAEASCLLEDGEGKNFSLLPLVGGHSMCLWEDCKKAITYSGFLLILLVILQATREAGKG